MSLKKNRGLKIALILLLLFAYIIAFILNFKTIGITGIAFSVMPIFVAARAFGIVGGGIASLLVIIINTTVIPKLVGIQQFPIESSIFLILIGVFIGLTAIKDREMKKELAKRRDIEEKLAQAELWYRNIFDGVNDAIFVETTKGKVLDVNARACEIYGWTREEFLTKTIKDIVPLEHQALLPDEQDETTISEKPFETVNMRANGEYFPVSVTGRVWGMDYEKQLLLVVRDITERKKAEAELLKLSRAIYQSPTAIVITNLEGNIEYINPAFTKITGYTWEEILGKNPNVLQSGFHSKAFYKELWRTLLAGKVWRGEFRNKDKEGKLFWESASISPITNPEGKITHYVAVKEDITERKQVMIDLEKAKNEAEIAAQVKAEFLANMSHEIRTPLNAIYGMTSLMLDTPLNEEQQDFIETIRDGGNTLLTVINDILDFSKIEAGKMELEKQPFSLRDCVEDTLNLLSEKALKKMLSITYIIDENTPYILIGDITRLRQILVNLLGNAIKFTDKGEIVINIKSHLVENNQHELEFSIRDTGIGIPKDKLKNLFQSFTQVDSSTTRKYGGTGLGLAISKELVEKMNGTMWVESEEGKGSTFYFTVIMDTEEGAQPIISNEERAKLTGKKLLIVDDNAASREILSTQTESWGMKPYAFASGDEALSLLEKGEEFDIAILDMQTPKIGGFSLAEKIHKKYTKKNIPTIILTSIKRDKARSSDTKIAAFLNKPIKISNLYNILIDIVSSQLSQESKTKKLLRIDSTMGKEHPLRILLAEDNIINQKVVLKLLERLGYQADLAANGIEVIESLERQPYDIILMDIQMPEMDGDEAAKHIRKKYSQENQPYIIAMTAHALEGDREKFMAHGMDNYVSKPVNAAILAKALEKAYLAKRKKNAPKPHEK